MAETYKRQHRKEFDREEQRGCEIVLHRTYCITVASPLADVDLEEGDTLPDDATARIISSRIVIDKKSGMAELAEVTAHKYLPWAD